MMRKSYSCMKIMPPVPFLACFVAMMLWAQTFSTIEYGCAIDAQEQILESLDLAKSIASAEDPQWRAKGDLRRKYHFPAADADHGGMIPLVLPGIFEFFDRCRSK